jgi:hypothetical protein
MSCPRPSVVHTLLGALALAALPTARALDSAGVLPRLLAAHPAVATVPDCPYRGGARECVLLDDPDPETAVATLLGELRSVVGTHPTRAGDGLAFTAGDTRYRIALAPRSGRPDRMVATVNLAPTRLGQCASAGRLFELAARPSLSAAELAELGSDIACTGADAGDGRDLTPLAVAAATGNADAALALLRGGADPNALDAALWTPLLRAARSGSPTLIDTLLRFGADPSYVAPDGASLASLAPLNAALAHGMSALLAIGAATPLRPATWAWASHEARTRSPTGAQTPLGTQTAAGARGREPAGARVPVVGDAAAAGEPPAGAARPATAPPPASIGWSVALETAAGLLAVATLRWRARVLPAGGLPRRARAGARNSRASADTRDARRAEAEARRRRRAGLVTLELPPPLRR